MQKNPTFRGGVVTLPPTTYLPQKQRLPIYPWVWVVVAEAVSVTVGDAVEVSVEVTVAGTGRRGPPTNQRRRRPGWQRNHPHLTM